ncbi:MAG: hypothetical protein H6865_08700 [Rhodospirillales bacterium]|nr:hypothetical protein [Alphaproteobacteria bacterium]MCB9987695.1 hypothetical protein [Rhodospirillales bacterium]USO08008.1 MAG: hypothetical protein H6866_01965 [Rhodospirillales bacterium]
MPQNLALPQDTANTVEQTYYILDWTLSEKFMGLAYSSSVGFLSGLAVREVAGLTFKFISLVMSVPEFGATLLGAAAFGQAAFAASEQWARHVPAQHLRLRTMRAPRINL